VICISLYTSVLSISINCILSLLSEDTPTILVPGIQGNPVRKKKRSKNAVHGGTLLYVVVVTYVTVMTILCIE
jgi:hypothetical protein